MGLDACRYQKGSWKYAKSVDPKVFTHATPETSAA